MSILLLSTSNLLFFITKQSSPTTDIATIRDISLAYFFTCLLPSCIVFSFRFSSLISNLMLSEEIRSNTAKVGSFIVNFLVTVSTMDLKNFLFDTLYVIENSTPLSINTFSSLTSLLSIYFL